MGLRVVIPVAGVGTRLRPHTHTRPKVLVHVAGKPMLGHILDELKRYDIEEITLVIGHLGDQVIQYVTETYPYKFRFIWQKEAKGLGHAIWLTAEGYREAEGPLMIILGDTLFDADFASVVHSSDNWIGVREVEDPRRFGVAVLEGGMIKAMVEKPPDPPSNLAMVGIYAVQKPADLYGALDEIIERNVTTQGEIQLTDALQLMLERGTPFKPLVIDEWYDCGKRETLLDTNRRLLARFNEKDGAPEPERFPGCVIRPPVAIEQDAVIENSIIGPNVSVGAGSTIRNSLVEDSIISADAEVADCLLRESIIADNAKVNGQVLVVNIGDATHVQLGATPANEV